MPLGVKKIVSKSKSKKRGKQAGSQNSENPVRVLSLFSGCGGMDIGAHNAGGKTIWANECNKWAIETYSKYFPNAGLVPKPIEDVDLDNELPKLGEVEVILGGFPCQDFSMIWKRPGLRGTRGNLYTFFVDIVQRLQPLAFIAENVKGLLSANNGKAIETIISDFNGCGYTLNNDDLVYNFADYGTPQLRERVLIIGIRSDLGVCFRRPEKTHAPQESAKSRGLKPYKSASEALRGVEKVKLNNECQNLKQSTIELLKLIPPGGNFTSVPKDHPRYVKGMISHVYRRLHPDQPSTTIIAGGGGGTWGYHFKKPRSLTNRERARLFDFPDDMEFIGPIGEVRRQIGNAVAPSGIEPVIRKLFQIIQPFRRHNAIR